MRKAKVKVCEMCKGTYSSKNPRLCPKCYNIIHTATTKVMKQYESKLQSKNKERV